MVENFSNIFNVFYTEDGSDEKKELYQFEKGSRIDTYTQGFTFKIDQSEKQNIDGALFVEVDGSFDLSGLFLTDDMRLNNESASTTFKFCGCQKSEGVCCDEVVDETFWETTYTLAVIAGAIVFFACLSGVIYYYQVRRTPW